MKYEKFVEAMKIINEEDNAAMAILESKHQRVHNVQGVYPYVSYTHLSSLWHVFSGIEKYFKKPYTRKEKSDVKILDVGAGTGRIPRIAKLFGFQACGIEFFEPYVKIGRKIHGLSDQELMVMDGFDITKEFIHKFDVVYTYMPIANNRKMSELILHLNCLVPFGGIIFVEMLPAYFPVTQFRELSTKNPIAEDNSKFVAYK